MSKKPRSTGGEFKKGRRPHNARKEEFGDIAELVRKLGSEKKFATINGTEVEMSWAERSFRLTVDRAIAGQRRDLAALLRLMIKHKNIGGSYREHTVIYVSRALANVV